MRPSNVECLVFCHPVRRPIYCLSNVVIVIKSYLSTTGLFNCCSEIDCADFVSAEQVRDAQLRAGSSAGMSGVWVADALGLPMHRDGLHLLTNGQVQLCTISTRFRHDFDTGHEKEKPCP